MKNYYPCCDGHAVFNSDFHTIDCLESIKDYQKSEPTEEELRKIEAENEKNNDYGQFMKDSNAE